MMAEIGKRTGVATIFGFKMHGFLAWWLWRTYYLANLPTIKKKLKVMSDWTADLIYKPDVAMIKKYMYERHEKEEEIGEEDRKDLHKHGDGSVHDKGEKNENDSSKKVQTK
jgi:NADH dehydrogenase